MAKRGSGRSKAMSSILASITLLQLVIVTASWIVSISRCFDGFIYTSKSTTDNTPFFLDVASGKAAATSALTTAEGAIVELYVFYLLV